MKEELKATGSERRLARGELHLQKNEEQASLISMLATAFKSPAPRKGKTKRPPCSKASSLQKRTPPQQKNIHQNKLHYYWTLVYRKALPSTSFTKFKANMTFCMTKSKSLLLSLSGSRKEHSNDDISATAATPSTENTALGNKMQLYPLQAAAQQWLATYPHPAPR